MALMLAYHIGVPISNVVNSGNVASIADFEADPMIIVGAVIGQGSQFVGISRDLRGRHKGNRLYLACIHIPSTYAAKNMLVRNLEKTKTGEGLYKFKAFCSLPSGAAGSVSFQAEQTLFEKFPDLNWPDVILSRFKALSKQRLGAPDFGFMPTGLSLDQALKLREGFTFWTSAYIEGAWASSVLWTIGATLQRAREDVGLPENLQLRSTALGQVFLDPENFTRFNDGVVQAAILRMALDHELDYRGQAEASNRMQRFLVRMFRNISDLNSEAVLEFLVSLATQRLRLEPEDLCQFVEQSIKHLENQLNSEMKQAVCCFLRILNMVFDLRIESLKIEERPF